MGNGHKSGKEKGKSRKQEKVSAAESAGVIAKRFSGDTPRRRAFRFVSVVFLFWGVCLSRRPRAQRAADSAAQPLCRVYRRLYQRQAHALSSLPIQTYTFPILSYINPYFPILKFRFCGIMQD